MIPSVTFLGGAGTVTGSKFLVEYNNQRVLVDCGLFQGYKQLRLRNRKPLPIEPAQVDAVVLTHAHIDHSGYVPLFVAEGFKGPIHCTDTTKALCDILLRDAGHLQEREAAAANHGGYSKHRPARPLYTLAQAEHALTKFRMHTFEETVQITPDITARFREAGHILGAAIVELHVGNKLLVFSGDLGRPNDPIMRPPSRISRADYLFVESTYGDRQHPTVNPQDALAEIINRTAARGGSVIIPSFAVGRAQLLLFHISELIHHGRIPDLPVYLDSPMAINATNLFREHADAHKLTPEQAKAVAMAARFTRSGKQSKELDKDREPKILISASGMATGGRILYHLKAYVRDTRNTILFAGFQAGGTRGAEMLAGANRIKIHGEYHPVRAEIANLHMLSAHADADEIMNWLSGFEAPPKKTFIIHGEPHAADALRHRIEEELNWNTLVAEHNYTEMLE